MIKAKLVNGARLGNTLNFVGYISDFIEAKFSIK